jgi:hypothetical protein
MGASAATSGEMGQHQLHRHWREHSMGSARTRDPTPWSSSPPTLSKVSVAPKHTRQLPCFMNVPTGTFLLTQTYQFVHFGPEGPTVRNRTVAYFLHYPGAGFRAAVEHSKVRSRNQHGDWKRIPVRLDVCTAGCSRTGKPRRLRHWRLYFPHCDPPRSEPV